jgi:uncharacterized protein YjdB
MNKILSVLLAVSIMFSIAFIADSSIKAYSDATSTKIVEINTRNSIVSTAGPNGESCPGYPPYPTTTPHPIDTQEPTPTPLSETPTPIATPTATPKPTVTPGGTDHCVMTPQYVHATGVKISKQSASINIGKTYKLTATVYPTNARYKSVIWKSSNTSIASVSSTGLVFAKAKGTAIITVKTVYGGLIATCKVTVIQPVTRVRLNKSLLTLKQGKTYKLIATLYPLNASNKKVTWKSGNKGIVRVSSTGVIKGIKKGTTYIYVHTVNGNKIAKCKVTIK